MLACVCGGFVRGWGRMAGGHVCAVGTYVRGWERMAGGYVCAYVAGSVWAVAICVRWVCTCGGCVRTFMRVVAVWCK